MLKRVDVAVYDCMKTAREGSWQPGARVLGLKEGGVDYALDEYNQNLITPEMKQRVEEAKAKIIAGEVTVKGYQP